MSETAKQVNAVLRRSKGGPHKDKREGVEKKHQSELVKQAMEQVRAAKRKREGRETE